jgi:hypothetical protein
MQLALSIIPQEIIDKYKLMDKDKNGKVYICIDKGMYGIPQAGRLANNLPVKRLAPHGYRPCEHTHNLWRHDTKPVNFTLVVDDFGIKYVGKENADHLLNALKENYEVTEDWAGKLYCGISLKLDYENKTVDLSMPGYIADALHKFQHKHPERPQHAHYPEHKPHYGSKVQLTPEVIDSPTLTPQGKKRIQQVVGALLYYGRAINGSIMTAIGSLASQQATGNINGRHRRKTNQTYQLLRHPPGRNDSLPRHRHDPEYPLRCWVPEQTRGKKQNRRTFIHELETKKWGTTTQWIDTHLIDNPPNGCG